MIIMRPKRIRECCYGCQELCACRGFRRQHRGFAFRDEPFDSNNLASIPAVWQAITRYSRLYTQDHWKTRIELATSVTTKTAKNSCGIQAVRTHLAETKYNTGLRHAAYQNMPRREGKCSFDLRRIFRGLLSQGYNAARMELLRQYLACLAIACLVIGMYRNRGGRVVGRSTERQVKVKMSIG